MRPLWSAALVVTVYRMTPGDGDERHGTVNGYTNLRCRCFPCRQAWAVSYAEQKARPRPPLPEDDPRHGTANAYNWWKCKCQVCRTGHALRIRLGRQKREA